MFVALAIIGFVAKAVANPWDKPMTPAPGAPQSIGKYTAGCVVGAHALKDGEVGLIHMRPQRRRNFGHPNLVEFIRGLGRHFHSNKLGTVLIGDLGLVRGGPTITNHVSHQSGLDVDIWFEVAPLNAVIPMAERRARHMSSFVDNDARKLQERFGPAQDELVRYSAKQPEVERIFVSAPVKAKLCANAEGDRSWLAKVRPWYGHRDHLHVRLRCPTDSTLCQSQKPIPDGDGCDDTLKWWMRGRAFWQLKPRDPNKPQRSPRLPKQCAALLKG